MDSIPRTSGIYIITCIPTGKFYVGSAVNLRKRWIRHQSDLELNRHNNSHLQNAWNKHTKQGFKFEILEHCNRDDLIAREQFYLDALQPFGKRGFNIGRKAGAASYGLPVSEETRRKISKSNSGKIRTPEMKEKQRAKMTGRTHTPEARAKVSKALMGHEVTEETRRKIGIAHKNQSDQTREKRRLSVIRAMTPERIEAMKIEHAKNTYIVTTPTGVEIEVFGLMEICRDNGLSNGNMYEVAKGRRLHHKGWKVRLK